MKTLTDIIRYTLITCLLLMAETAVAQIVVEDSTARHDNGIFHIGDSLIEVDDAALEGSLMADTIQFQKKKRDWSTWRPDPKRAMWLALVIPGAGQIYNHKYWKLPIIYGGFVGCIYAWRWNDMMYKDYSKAFMDITDNDPNTQSYNQYLHLGAKIDDSNKKTWKDRFQKRKDYYRRYRDMSIFILIGVYALSVIDAYVDASLSQFDISDDLSLRIQPAVINSQSATNPFRSSGVGLQCSLKF